MRELGFIHMQHGSGGEYTSKLLNDIIFKKLGNPLLNKKHDGAVFELGKKMAFSTDSFVISPIFFRGGNIGHLAVNGTVNDLAMCGAEPQYLSLAFIIEEGFSLLDFETIVDSIGDAAQKSGIKIVTGDTKVVERGKGDKIYINTSGVGTVHAHADIDVARICEGDVVIVNASIANHGMAIMSEREGLQFESDILSDCVNLNYEVKALLDSFGNHIHFLRDATRGGLASVLNEVVGECSFGITLKEEAIPVVSQVKSACEILGLDPLYVANEGVFVAIVSSSIAQEVLTLLQSKNRHANIIGKVNSETLHKVIMESAFGGRRVVNPLVGEQLPRIC